MLLCVQAVVELQRLLPNARIMYVSATGATDPENLLYMSRLGLWGEGTAFPTKLQFTQTLNSRGVGKHPPHFPHIFINTYPLPPPLDDQSHSNISLLYQKYLPQDRPSCTPSAYLVNGSKDLPVPMIQLPLPYMASDVCRRNGAGRHGAEGAGTLYSPHPQL